MSWSSASSANPAVYVTLVEMADISPAVYLHSGVGPIAWDGKVWLGVGTLGEIAGVGGGVDLDASDLTLTLSGVPSDLRSELLNEVARGDRVNIYHGFINEESAVWAHEPELCYAGFVDSSAITDEISEDGAAQVSISIGVISAAAYARRLTISRETDAAQQDLYPGDKFFSFLTDMSAPLPTPSQYGGLINGTLSGIRSVSKV